ncbi:MAG: hypothetical protein L0154_15430 [Chloroflexi bacterium]|nr:hypothetical protein [Chloroflexota bacterium]
MSNNITSEVIFEATNKHDEGQGKPPQISTSDTNKYCAYFENEFSEQFIFVYDYDEHSGTLWLSKKGWENPISVVDGKAQNAGLRPFEKTWLKGCWNVITAVEERRNHIQKLLKEGPAVSTPSVSSSHEETRASMGHLYDFLATTEFSPDCTKQEFVTGWTNLIEMGKQLKKEKMVDRK